MTDMTDDRHERDPAPKNEGDKTGAGPLFWGLVGTLALIAAAAIIWTWVRIGWAEATALTELGQRGDFFGGILNPILTFLTFVGLLVTLILQRKEMVESRVQFTRSADALSKQNVQSSFYQLLGVHNQIIEGLSVKDPATETIVNGREVFRVIYSDLRRDYRERAEREAEKPAARRRSPRELITHSYGQVYSKHQERLGHYFRYLYNTLLLLESAEKEAAKAGGSASCDADKFIKLLRALLSDQELLVLFYNVTVSAPGKNFNRLAIDHVLFDNMPARLLEDEHATYIDARALGAISYAARLTALRRDSAPGETDEVTSTETKPPESPIPATAIGDALTTSTPAKTSRRRKRN